MFTQTKADANYLMMSGKLNCNVEAMHGDISQHQREMTMKRFKEGKLTVLVATDVASRGLDIPNVDLIVQIEPPREVETYIHRSGRTARAGNKGTCITFYNQQNEFLLHSIEREAGIKFQSIEAPSHQDLMRARQGG